MTSRGCFSPCAPARHGAPASATLPRCDSAAASGATRNRIVRYTASTNVFSSLISGADTGLNGTVQALTVFGSLLIAGGSFTNVGTQPIRFEVVSFKPLVAVAGSPAASPAGASKFRHLNYPNIPGEDLLENDEVIVQRFLVQPGQWEGVHAHHPDMLYIHVKGGRWAARSYTEKFHVYPDDSPDGSVGWMRTTPITEGHESQNAGKEPIDLIWVTLKR
mgnify:CR=1 FL=1